MAQELTHQWDIADYDIRQRWRTRPPEEFPAKWACEWGFDEYGLWQTFVVKGINHKMRYIPHGTFLMGSPEDESGDEDEKPQHQVTLTHGFWLGETTVTQALWQAITGENPSLFKPEADEKLPVESVSWHDCRAFCEKLSELMGARFTFPTEAQWEYACRAGTASPFNTGDNLGKEQANFNGDLGNTMDVYQFQPNAWGLKQMHGNVWEWCLDDMRDYKAQKETNPTGALQASNAVLRGGSWNYDGRLCRSAYRYHFRRDDRYSGIGLRVAQVSNPEG